jgi:predicted Zn finger-like uncharacterized protein
MFLIIQCSACHARYHYDESRFRGLVTKKIRCTKCSAIFEIRNPVPAAGAAPDPPGPARAGGLPGPDEFSLDETAMTEPGRRKQAPGAPARAMPLVEPPKPAPPAPPGITGPLPPAPPVGMTSAAARTTDRVPVAGAAAAPSTRLRLPAIYRLSLACIAGPDSGRIFEIEKPRVVIGRSNADVLLADIQCSRNHAALEIQDDRVTLVDLGSTNGTYVADQRINRVELENRSEFEIGTTTLMLIRSATDAPSGS